MSDGRDIKFYTQENVPSYFGRLEDKCLRTKRGTSTRFTKEKFVWNLECVSLPGLPQAKFMEHAFLLVLTRHAQPSFSAAKTLTGTNTYHEVTTLLLKNMCLDNVWICSAHLCSELESIQKWTAVFCQSRLVLLAWQRMLTKIHPHNPTPPKDLFRKPIMPGALLWGVWKLPPCHYLNIVAA